MFDFSTLLNALPVADGPGWWIVFAPLGWFLVIAGLILLFRFVVFRRGPWGAGGACGPGGPRSASRLSPAEILERRFAQGELSTDEYRERRSVLADEANPGASSP
jgi:putative membrane protein